MVTFNPQIELKFYSIGSLPSQMSESTFITQKTKYERSKFSVSSFGQYELLQVKKECIYNKLYLWITVPNFEYQKEIRFRYTTNNWSSYQDIVGTFVESIKDLTNNREFDTFVCILDIEQKQFQSLDFCIKFQYGSREFWENNQGKNYTIDLWRKEVLRLKKQRQCINEMDLRRVPFQFLL